MAVEGSGRLLIVRAWSKTRCLGSGLGRGGERCARGGRARRRGKRHRLACLGLAVCHRRVLMTGVSDDMPLKLAIGSGIRELPVK